MQARAEATRRAILNAAVDLFDTVGYADAALTDLMDGSGVGKGAMYYHFRNREEVAAAVIAEADAKLREATMKAFSDPGQPALAKFIRSVFVTAHLTANDPVIRTGVKLRNELRTSGSEFAGGPEHRQMCTAAVAAGIAEGDLRADLDPDQAGHTLSTAILGTHRLCETTGEDLHARLADVLTLTLRAICGPGHLEHYTHFVSAEARGGDGPSG